MVFSIIIPVYNVEKYLRECLNSVLGQTFPNWEVICVNDGSTDSSASILEVFATKDNRVRIVTQPNSGLSAARNVGLKHASGEYILFLDSDDWLEVNALEILANDLCDEDMVCFSGCRYLESEGRFLPADQLQERRFFSGMDYYNEDALKHRDFAFVCVVLRAYKRSFLLKNRLVFKEGIFHEDNLFTPLACYYAQKVKVINYCLYNYRVRHNSITTTKNLKRMRDLMGAANDLALFFTHKTGFDKTIVYRAITHYYQAVLGSAPKSERRIFKQLCDWKLYWLVSRTKPRHIVNYWINRFSI